MAKTFTLETFDNSLVFAIAVFLVVVGLWGVASWGFSAAGWTGPLSLLKGGVVGTGSTASPATGH